jgi:hypothetical protein
VDSDFEGPIFRFLDIERVIEIFGSRRINREHSLGSQIISRLELSFWDTACQSYTYDRCGKLTTMEEEVDT